MAMMALLFVTFPLQCKPEYKVPGLYVIDSIVRQSRHQFGTEKDVFAPRFSKNIIATFQHLYRCSSDDKVREFALAFLMFSFCWLCFPNIQKEFVLKTKNNFVFKNYGLKKYVKKKNRP